MRTVSRRDFNQNSSRLLNEVTQKGATLLIKTQGQPDVLVTLAQGNEYDRLVASGEIDKSKGGRLTGAPRLSETSEVDAIQSVREERADRI